MKRLLAMGLSGIFILSISGCSDNPSRREVLRDLADEVIIPSYSTFADRSKELTAALEATCSAPTQDHMRDVDPVLRATASSWHALEPMLVGPAMSNKSSSIIDAPINKGDIDKLLANNAIKLDVETIAHRVGADERGLQGIDYVAHSFDFDARHCEYLSGSAKSIENEALSLLTAWRGGTGTSLAYRETFSGATPDADVDVSVDSVVNDQINLLRMINKKKSAIDELRMQLTSMRRVLVGDENTKGLSPLLDKQLSDRVDEAIQAPLRDLDRIDNAGQDNAGQIELETLETHVDELRRVISTEVVSELGVAVGFSDADGDSAK